MLRKRGPESLVRSRADSFGRLDSLERELEVKKDQLHTAAQLGKALLEANSLTREKEDYRLRMESLKKQVEEEQGKVVFFVSEGENLKSRNELLVRHLRQAEASHSQVVVELERAKLDLKAAKLASPVKVLKAVKTNEEALRHEMEKSSARIDDLKKQLNHKTVQLERAVEKLENMEKEELPRLRADALKCADAVKENESLRKQVKALGEKNQKLVASNFVLQQTHERVSRGSLALTVATLKSPGFIDQDALTKDLVALRERRAKVSARDGEMVAFLTDELPKDIRYLTLMLYWRKESSRCKALLAEKKMELERKVEELKSLKSQQSPPHAQMLGDMDGMGFGDAFGPSLADEQLESEVDELKKEMAEMEERFEQEKQQLLHLLNQKQKQAEDSQELLKEISVLKSWVEESRGNVDRLEQVCADRDEKIRRMEDAASGKGLQFEKQLEDKENAFRKEKKDLENGLRVSKLEVTVANNKIGELLLENKVMKKALNEMASATAKSTKENSQVENRRKSLTHRSMSPYKLDEKAKSVADLSAYVKQTSSSSKTIQQVVALQKQIKEVAYQRDRYQRIISQSTKKYEDFMSKAELTIQDVKKENARLRKEIVDYENTPVAEDLKVELFFSLALAVKLSLAAEGASSTLLNRNVQDLYDMMMDEDWKISQWPPKILEYFTGENE